MRRPSFTWVRWCRTIVGGHLSRFRVFLPGRRRKRRRSNNNHDRDVALTDGCSCFWAARLLFWPELWGAGDEVGDDVTGPPTAPSADPPGEWLLADPLPISLPLPDGPPLVELLDADNVVLDPMLNVPAVLLLLFFFVCSRRTHNKLQSGPNKKTLVLVLRDWHENPPLFCSITIHFEKNVESAGR